MRNSQQVTNFFFYSEKIKNDLERVKSDILVNISEQLDAVTTEMLGRLFCKQYLFLMPTEYKTLTHPPLQESLSSFLFLWLRHFRIFFFINCKGVLCKIRLPHGWIQNSMRDAMHKLEHRVSCQLLHTVDRC